MTAFEALWIIKTQLQKNDQNLEAVKVLEDIVKSIHRVHIDDDEPTYTLQEAIDYIEMGTEAEHIKNHMAKIAKKDIKELNMCARYEWAEDDDVVKFFNLCETEE